MNRIATIAAACIAATLAGPLAAQPLASDAEACRSGGPAILATIAGLKDRTGSLKLELYPDNEADFLKDDRDLIKQGKFFRRVVSITPPSGAVEVCIKVPRPGRYALLFTHNRDGKNKFNFWRDGAGFPGNAKLGRRRPTAKVALITVSSGITPTRIQAQYLRGLGGFGPLKR